MSLAEAPGTITLTAERIIEMPNDGIERDLIRGELRERPMTLRNFSHSATEANITFLLGDWQKNQSSSRKGQVLSGEAGFRLLRQPDTFVGIDVAYISAEMAAGHDRKQSFFEGAPVLAVEILSPSDQHAYIVDKVEVYLEVGTVVWVVDPDFRTVTVHRPGESPEPYNDRQELSGDPYLPGVCVRVAQFFDA